MPDTLRVLVVEDTPDSAELLVALLEDLDCIVRLATDGGSAIQLASSFLPHVAVLDLGLPGIDGFEVARRIRQDPATSAAVLVACTGFDDPHSRQQARNAGFDEYFTKPSGFERVIELVSGLRVNPARRSGPTVSGTGSR